ncbi:MAG: hypothetical protein A3A86_05995 [Elusimicrobia bacterium RIFCSPLOWO2_01_FULL_60_11]|nr:MAG: hypothetical protein A3A86_05995 [Elusimicrobia bacterium RIFCSPLOWO2_01_FULL_60_11]
MNKARGLYIHIPFCRMKCRFCHFATFPGLREKIPDYLSALEKEMRFHEPSRLNTVFLGGGTPSILSPRQILRLMGSIHRHFTVEKGAEISMEWNPEDGNLPKLKATRETGVNRVSFGLQAVQDSHLRSLGRLHDFKKFTEAFGNARRAGFGNINIDLMFGLPGQTLADWTETLDKVLALSPEHLSAYALDLDEPSALSFQKTAPDDELQADMYEILNAKLAGEGYIHYEISNFAKPGHECRHNLKYWRNEPCLGIGLSAAGYDGATRAKNHGRMEAYLTQVGQKKQPVMEKSTLSERDRIGEGLMLGLRLKEGAYVTPETSKFFGDILEKYRDLGLLSFSADSSRAALNLNGWMVSNRIFLDILN